MLKLYVRESGPRAYHRLMAEAPPTPAPGWYPDPKMVDTRRYWDGAEWTDQVAPVERVPERDQTGLIVAGYVLAFLFPIGGFIVGVLLPGRGRQGKHQTAIITLSVIGLLAWAALIF